MAAEVRRRQLLDAAASLVLAQGYLPLSLDALAAKIGASKGLIYEYFPTQADLFNALLVEEAAAIDAAGLEQAADLGDLVAAAQACADLYLLHVAAHGPLAHFILRDVYMRGRLDPAGVRGRERFLRAMARRARRELQMPAAQALAAVLLVQAIPEEMGRLVWQGDLPAPLGRDLTGQLIASSIAALRPTPSLSDD